MRRIITGKKTRSKREILLDYLVDLVKYEIINLEGKTYEEYLDINQDKILSILLEKLYETEEFNGQLVSTVDAFFHFCEYVIRYDLVTKKRIWNNFVKQMFLMIEHNQLTCFMSSRSSGKSFMVYILYPLFKSFLVEYYDAVLCSNTPRMCKNNFRKLMRLIDGNELLLEKKAVELGRDLTWNESEIEYNNGLIYTLSLGTTPRSAHVCYVVGDDPLRDDNKYTDEYTHNYFIGQLKPTILRRKGRMVIVGTPQSETDLFHTLMSDKDGKIITDGKISKSGFYSKTFKAILDEDKKQVLVPEVFTYEQLVQERELLGEVIFNREYQCVCVSDETTLFPYSLIKACTDNQHKILSRGMKDRTYCIGADIATSAEASADYSAFIVLEVFDDPVFGLTKIIRNIVWVKGMKVTEQIDTLESLSKEFNNAYTLVEKNNVGVALIQELEERGVNVDEFVTDRFKKEGMIRFLSNELRRKRLVFPEETYEVKMLKNELENFGVRIKRGKEVMEAIGGHDDLVLSLAICNQATQQIRSSTPFAITQN